MGLMGLWGALNNWLHIPAWAGRGLEREEGKDLASLRIILLESGEEAGLRIQGFSHL